MPIRLTLWTCGQCGKPRGMHHLCTGGRKGRDRIRLTVAVKCRNCGKPAPNPLTHTCSVRSDWQKRKAAQKRAQQTAERQRKRRAAAARKRARLRERKRAAAERRRQQRKDAADARRKAARSQTHDRTRHEYAECGDEHCTASRCRVYREGIEAGKPEGHAEGYSEGYGDGLRDAQMAI